MDLEGFKVSSGRVVLQHITCSQQVRISITGEPAPVTGNETNEPAQPEIRQTIWMDYDNFNSLVECMAVAADELKPILSNGKS